MFSPVAPPAIVPICFLLLPSLFLTVSLAVDIAVGVVMIVAALILQSCVVAIALLLLFSLSFLPVRFLNLNISSDFAVFVAAIIFLFS